MNWEIEFNEIISDILVNENFIDLKYVIHHGISRLDHSLHVARITYLLCKKLHMKNLKEVTRAALLHDFFDNKEKFAFYKHADWALENAMKEFQLNSMQQNIIASHMFPICHTLPNCKESFIVSTVDKMVALYELTKYKVPIEIGAIFIFVINFLAIQR